MLAAIYIAPCRYNVNTNDANIKRIGFRIIIIMIVIIASKEKPTSNTNSIKLPRKTRRRRAYNDGKNDVCFFSITLWLLLLPLLFSSILHTSLFRFKHQLLEILQRLYSFMAVLLLRFFLGMCTSLSFAPPIAAELVFMSAHATASQTATTMH